MNALEWSDRAVQVIATRKPLHTICHKTYSLTMQTQWVQATKWSQTVHSLIAFYVFIAPRNGLTLPSKLAGKYVFLKPSDLEALISKNFFYP